MNAELCESIRPCSCYIGITKPLKTCTSISEADVSKQRNPLRSFIKKIYLKLGIDELRYRPFILQENLKEVEQFNPEIILCGLGNLNQMRLCLKLSHLLPKSKIVLYIVDDWVNSRVSDKWPSVLWRKRYDKAFRDVLSISSGNLSICQEMSDAYKERYGIDFVPFHNPVDVSFWESLCSQKKYGSETVSLLYVGKINADTQNCLIDCCKVVEELNNEGKSICFDVYSPNYRIKYDLFDSYNHCHLFPPVPHESIPELTKSYSALFLTLGFSKESIKYVKLSMPTKLTEYLASGLPTVLYCSSEIALFHYVQANGCAFICSKRKLSELKRTLLGLFEEEEVAHIVDKAKTTVRKHDASLVRSSFLKTLKQFLS